MISKPKIIGYLIECELELPDTIPCDEDILGIESMILYIGKKNTMLNKKPEDSKMTFSSVKTAKDHMYKYQDRMNYKKCNVIPVYETEKSIIKAERITVPSIPEAFEFKERTRPQRLRKDAFRNYNELGPITPARRKVDMIPKLK